MPAWMSEEAARSATLTTRPRLSVDRLMDLRRQLNSLQASRGESAPQGGGDHVPQDRAGSATCSRRITSSASPDQPEATLIRLIEELLVEAIGDGSVKARADGNAAREARHEQDHA